MTNRLPKPGTSLAELRPDLAAQWHPTRNDSRQPVEVTTGSSRKVWWKCPNGPDHEWSSKVSHRVSGAGCPCCAGRQVSVTNSVASIPELATQWHPTLNGDLRPEDVVAGTRRKLWWKCPAGPDHEWQATGDKRVRGSGCPFCAGARVSVTNSVASIPELATQWHPTLNGDLRPEDVVAGTPKKLWWKCPEAPDHEWCAFGYARVAGSGCPFCRGLAVSATNSLARFPEVVAQWHPTRNGDTRPENVIAGSHKTYWWKCSEGPDHEWRAVVEKRTQGSSCPFCLGQRASVTNSVASIPEMLAQWHPTRNGDLRPEDVVAGTHQKLWWKCSKGPEHEWQAIGQSRKKGAGCPFCVIPGGYKTYRPGSVYLLSGDEWGKVGISNVLPGRLAKHEMGRVFGPLVLAAEFHDGTQPVRVERSLCDFIAERSSDRAPVSVDGYTESFPAWMLPEVEVEMRRLLDELPVSDWTLIDHPPPERPGP
jgi:hypothetical protein